MTEPQATSDLKPEEWREIPGWPYEVSDCGNVRRLGSPKLKALDTSHRGYKRTWLYDGDKKKLEFVHRMVLAAHVGPCPAGYQTNHINGVRDDNRLANLEWVTPSENTRHAIASGLFTPTPQLGSRHGSAKLTEAEIPVIRHMASIGWRQTSIAKVFSVTPPTIRRVLSGRNWSHV